MTILKGGYNTPNATEMSLESERGVTVDSEVQGLMTLTTHGASLAGSYYNTDGPGRCLYKKWEFIKSVK